MRDDELDTEYGLAQERRKEYQEEIPQSLNLSFSEETEEEDQEPSLPLQSAVLASLTLGHPALQIAHRFGLPVKKVRELQAAYDIDSRRTEELDRMLLIFVQQEIESLIAISIATADEEWIRSQTAPDLAVFISAKQDRLMRILEAFGRSQSSRKGLQGEVVHGR